MKIVATGFGDPQLLQAVPTENPPPGRGEVSIQVRAGGQPPRLQDVQRSGLDRLLRIGRGPQATRLSRAQAGSITLSRDHRRSHSGCGPCDTRTDVARARRSRRRRAIRRSARETRRQAAGAELCAGFGIPPM